MAKFKHHRYEYTNCLDTLGAHHRWELVGPAGGVHFSASMFSELRDPICGLEFHHSARAGYRQDEAPDHLECHLLKEPCWHDGTSFYASKTIWPMIKPLLQNGDHEAVFRFLEREYERRFARLAGDA